MAPELLIPSLEEMGHNGKRQKNTQLRASGYKQPIIALTAHAMAEERARTMAAGCNGHLTKLLDKIELLRTIQFYASKDSKRENFIEQ